MIQRTAFIAAVTVHKVCVRYAYIIVCRHDCTAVAAVTVAEDRPSFVVALYGQRSCGVDRTAVSVAGPLGSAVIKHDIPFGGAAYGNPCIAAAHNSPAVAASAVAVLHRCAAADHKTSVLNLNQPEISCFCGFVLPSVQNNILKTECRIRVVQFEQLVGGIKAGIP